MSAMDIYEIFAKQWDEKFGSEVPDFESFNNNDINEKINELKEKIKDLRNQLEKEEFKLEFLQSLSSTNVNAAASETSINENTNVKLRNTEPWQVSQVKSSKNSNRISKVMENVKMFEQGKSSHEAEEPVSNNINENRIKPGLPNRTSSRKRAPYLEVWQCKTGDEHMAEDMVKSNEEIDKMLNDQAVDAISGGLKKQSFSKSKSRPSSYPVRDNYVEVWTCSTGDLKDPTNPDLDVALNDLAEHQTLPNSSGVKMRYKDFRNDPSNNRLTWPTPINQPLSHPMDGYTMDSNTSQLYPSLSEFADSDCSIDVKHLENNDADEVVQNIYIKDVGVVSEEDSEYKGPGFKSATIAAPGEYLNHFQNVLTTSERVSSTYDRRLHRDTDSEEFDFTWNEDEDSNDNFVNSDDDDDECSESESNNSNYNLSDEKLDKLEDENVDDSYNKKEDFSDDNDEEDEGINDDSITDSANTSQSFARAGVSSLVDYQKVRNIAEAEKLRMRWWVVSSLLEGEETYLEYLNTLLLYMKPIKATIGSSQPVMSSQDFDILFYRVVDLHSLHASFYEHLKPRLDDWSADTIISDVFQKLSHRLGLYADYVKNYKRAQQTAEKCAKENKQFAFIIESLKVQSHKTKDAESISLTEILYKPVERVMRHTLVLQDILRHTPHRHPDHHILRQVLKHGQIFLEKISAASSHGRHTKSAASQAAARAAEREMKKDGYLVELTADGQRKLRHIFLFNDLLLCTKPKNATGVFHSKDTYECKWYIPLADLSFKPSKDVEGIPTIPDINDDELKDLTIKASGLKREIAAEKKRLSIRQKKYNQSHKNEDRQNKPALTSRNLDRLRRKLAEIEGQIILAAPNLPLRIFHMQGKVYVLLMSSDFERDEWTEAIIKCQEVCFKSFALTTIEVQNLLASCVRNRKVSNVGYMLAKDDEDLLSGYITVTIHSGGGFLHPCNPYIKLEVDSYGHFQTRAKTPPCHNTQNPEWNAEFEFEVDGAQILRILCYDSAKGVVASYEGDVLIAKGTVKLAQDSLKADEWSKEKVLISDLDINISIKFTPREQSLMRTPSHKSNGMFGVRLGVVSKRENSSVPSIVKKCIAEIEKRGMQEIGIYRVSGVASGVQLLKASFDSNRKDIGTILQEVDINSVAGVLKLYFRELPEPLFTDKLYSDFVDAINLADPETKNKTICRLLASLPLANYHTFIYLRNHLLKVAQLESENKMSLHNIATVFGPTLLRPAENKKIVSEKQDDVSILNNLRMDVHYQMGVLLYCLELEDIPKHSSEKAATPNDPKLPSFNQSRNKNDGSKRNPGLDRSKSPLTSSMSISEEELKTFNKDSRRHNKVPRQASMGNIKPDKPTKPVNRASTTTDNKTSPLPPRFAPRNHPYETVEGIGSPDARIISSPNVKKKPTPGAKPTPAPRKPSKR